jgi:hypothetical protein
MKIGFFTEGGYQGKVPRENPNMRTDMAWICALDATHHPINTIHELPDNLYDVGIVIIPKKRQYLIEYPLVEQLKRVCGKIASMQESTYWYWQDDPIVEQIWYFNTLTEMDMIFCHNKPDLQYYKGIIGDKCHLLQSLMITDNIKVSETKTNSAMIGGNFVSIYRGFDSYMVAREMTEDICAPTTGRMKKEETGLDINHLPWVNWLEWIYELSKHKYGVQLGTPSAGTFNLNCSYLGIPCIGYDNVDTQMVLHPDLSVSDGDIHKAKKLAVKLKTDDEFYIHCSEMTKQLYKKHYSEKIFLEKTIGILNETN